MNNRFFYRIAGPLVCVDCEFIPGANILTEIGFYSKEKKLNKSWLIKPSLSIRKAISHGQLKGIWRMTGLTGITLDHLMERGITVGALKKQFDNMSLYNKTLVHWGGPDPAIIGETFYRYFNPHMIPRLHFLDLQMEWSRWNMIDKKTSLLEAVKKTGITITENIHRAATDAKLTYYVLSYMITQGWNPNGEISVNEIFCKDPGFVFPMHLDNKQLAFLTEQCHKHSKYRKDIKKIKSRGYPLTTKDCGILCDIAPNVFPPNEYGIIGLSQLIRGGDYI